MENIEPDKSNKLWIKTGLIWGLFMFVSMTFISPLLKGNEITLSDVLISIPVWVLAGLGFGYAMKNIGKKL
jgi:hypothetical protein